MFSDIYSIQQIRLEAARLKSLGLKFVVIPPEYGFPGKSPMITGWPQQALEEWVAPEEIPEGCNLGVLCGAPVERNGKTYYVADVDIDHASAVAIFKRYLPPTMMWGRIGKPRSHYLYLVDKPITTISGSATCGVVELRCLAKHGRPGHQSVVPPSVWQKNGEFQAIRYEPDSFSEPIIISAEELMRGLHV